MTVTFRCGHSMTVPREAAAAPTCPCGERVVSRVTGAAPKFVGACRGPHCETRALEPHTAAFVDQRLTLKE